LVGTYIGLKRTEETLSTPTSKTRSFATSTPLQVKHVSQMLIVIISIYSLKFSRWSNKTQFDS